MLREIAYSRRMIESNDIVISGPGGDIPAVLTLPESGSGPGVVLVQEIFGVNTYIREVAERLAGEGYVVIAPHMYWRIQPDFAIEATGPDDLAPAMEVAGKFQIEDGMADIGATIAHLAGMSEVTGPIGIIGFCFGGSMSYMTAANHQPACAVAYYGSMIAGNLDLLPKITCPILFHFGDQDPFLSNDDVESLRRASDGMTNTEILVQPGAGHAFDNHRNPMFSKPHAAAAAWARTSEFLSTHLKA